MVNASGSGLLLLLRLCLAGDLISRCRWPGFASKEESAYQHEE